MKPQRSHKFLTYQTAAESIGRPKKHARMVAQVCDLLDAAAAYLECHHILALADQGEDRMGNVIAICPGDHREVHFGKRRDEIEAEMIAKVKIAEAKRKNELAALKTV